MNTSQTPSFEEALQRLEEIAQELEAHIPDLETALQRYEEGVSLAQYCLERLQEAQLRVQKLSLDELLKR